jgi:hypothetical protein
MCNVCIEKNVTVHIVAHRKENTTGIVNSWNSDFFYVMVRRNDHQTVIIAAPAQYGI